MLADRLGWAKPLVELMRGMTQREYLLRLEWIKKDEERPRLTDWYLMSVAAEVRRSQYKDPSRVKIKDLMLVKSDDEKKLPKTREQASAQSMAVWGARLGVKRKELKNDAS